MRKSETFNILWIRSSLGAVFLIIGFVAMVRSFSSAPLYMILSGGIATWVGLWGLRIECSEIRNDARKLKIAYLIGFLGIVLCFVGLLILYMYASGFTPVI